METHKKNINESTDSLKTKIKIDEKFNELEKITKNQIKQDE
jgi:hypothetical protein